MPFDLLLKKYPKTFGVGFGHQVTPDPEEEDASGSGAGGGEGDHEEDATSSDGDLGEKGQSALTKLRTSERTLRARAEAAERQLEALSKNVSPEAFEAAKKTAEEAQKAAAAANQALETERTRLSKKHQRELAQANDRATAAELRAQTKTIEFLTKEHFTAAGGDNSVDQEGISSFKAFMTLKGHRHIRLRGEDELYIVDAAGDPLLDDKGKEVLVSDWITKQADTSPVLARLFKPRQGEGGGVRGTNGVRGVRGPDMKDLNHNQAVAAAWPD